MTDLPDRLSDRFVKQRDAAASRAQQLSTDARDVAEAARRRIETTYGTVRERAGEWLDQGRDAASAGMSASATMAKRGRGAVDRAAVASRELVTDRPLAAVAMGIAAGVLLGFLANRLTQAWRADAPPAADDDERYTDY